MKTQDHTNTSAVRLTDSDSVNLGSNPSSPATNFSFKIKVLRREGWLCWNQPPNPLCRRPSSLPDIPKRKPSPSRAKHLLQGTLLMTHHQEVQAIRVSARMRARRTCSGFIGSSRSVVALIKSPPSGVRSVRISRATLTPAACLADRQIIQGT
jgi:hypothetical protein